MQICELHVIFIKRIKKRNLKKKREGRSVLCELEVDQKTY